MVITLFGVGKPIFLTQVIKFKKCAFFWRKYAKNKAQLKGVKI